MADVTIDSVVSVGFPYYANRAGIFWKTPLIGYFFFMGSPATLKYRKTTNGGTTWNTAVDVETGSVTQFDCFADWEVPNDTGEFIHVAYIEYGTGYVRYRKLDTSTDTLGSVVNVITDGIDPQPIRTKHHISITKSVGNRVYIAYRYTDDVSSVFYGFYYAASPWTTFTVRDNPWNGDGSDYILLVPANLADTNDIWAVYWDKSTNIISLMTFDSSANSWSAGTTISSSMVDDDVFLQHDAKVRHSDGHLILCAWSALDSSSADLKTWDIDGESSITAKANVITDTAETATCSVFINQGTGDIYIAYVTGTAFQSEVACVYKKSTDGMDSWGSEQTMQEGAEDDERWVSCGAVRLSGGGKFMPAWYNDDLTDLFCNANNAVSIAGLVVKSVADDVAVSDSVVGALTMLKALADIVGVSDWFDNGFIDPPLTADVVEKLWSYADL